MKTFVIGLSMARRQQSGRQINDLRPISPVNDGLLRYDLIYG